LLPGPILIALSMALAVGLALAYVRFFALRALVTVECKRYGPATYANFGWATQRRTITSTNYYSDAGQQRCATG